MRPRWTIVVALVVLFWSTAASAEDDVSRAKSVAFEAVDSAVAHGAIASTSSHDVEIVDTFHPTLGHSGKTTALEAMQPPKEARSASEMADFARESMDQELDGKPIGRIEFECDLRVCENPASAREFALLTGLTVGERYRTSSLKVGVERLAKTGFFAKLSVSKELVQDAVFITIKGTGATLIREVGFTGLDTPPFESDLRKVLSYRQGQAYRGDKAKAQAQLESFKSIYQRDGYFGTRIELYARPVGSSKHLVDLEFRIKKGQARQVCDVGFKGVKAMKYAEAREWLLSDGSFLSQRLNLYDTTYTTKGFRKGQNELIQEYRRRGYFQARVIDKAAQFDGESKCVTLLVEVREGPHWGLKFVGAKRFVESDLVGILPFFESGYVDREEIRRAEASIRKLYETRGYPFAKVSAQEVKNDALDRVLEFQIDEGPQLEVREIQIHGNDAVSDDEILAVMGTQVFALFGVGGYLQTDELLGDMGRIEALYQERGYGRAVVERFALERLDDDGLRVHLYINQGEQTLVERVDVDGNRRLPDGILKEGLVVTQGNPFYALSLKADQTKVLQKYATRGHPLARVRTSCFLPTGEQVSCEAPRMARGCVARTVEELEGGCRWAVGAHETYLCSRLKSDRQCVFEGGVNASSMRVQHEVSEGPLVRAGPRLLKGNFETMNSVIHREIPIARGDLLDTQQVIAGQGNLRQLNVFDSVSIETIGLDEGAADALTAEAALLINVEEARTSYVDVRFGFEIFEPFADNSQFLLSSEVQYTNRNLLGSAQGIQPRIITAIDMFQLADVVGQLQSIDPTRVDTVDIMFGAELLYSHPRFLKDLTGIERLFFTLGPFYLLDLLGVLDRQLLREEWGVRADFRKDLSELLNRLFFKLGVEFKQVATFQEDGTIINNERIFSPRQTRGKLEPDLAYDQRDSPLNPKKGFLLRAQPALVSGDAFGQGGENFFGDSFLRFDASASYFVPFWKGLVVLAQSLRYGQIFPLAGRDTPVPVDERFFLGGVRSVRGFQENALGPVNDNQVPTGGEFYMNYNMELRYPILAQFSIFGATFLDAGILADCFPDDRSGRGCGDSIGEGPLSTVRASAGLGLRALIFDQLPIVLDYGIVLNRRPGERYGLFHLNVGYTFD